MQALSLRGVKSRVPRESNLTYSFLGIASGGALAMTLYTFVGLLTMSIGQGTINSKNYCMSRGSKVKSRRSGTFWCKIILMGTVRLGTHRPIE